jgi:hypothetical protein
MTEEFTAEDFCTVIFDEFFFAGIARENVIRHLLKLLWYTHAKLPAGRLETLVKALQPSAQVRWDFKKTLNLIVKLNCIKLQCTTVKRLCTVKA